MRRVIATTLVAFCATVGVVTGTALAEEQFTLPEKPSDVQQQDARMLLNVSQADHETQDVGFYPAYQPRFYCRTGGYIEALLPLLRIEGSYRTVWPYYRTTGCRGATVWHTIAYRYDGRGPWTSVGGSWYELNGDKGTYTGGTRVNFNCRRTGPVQLASVYDFASGGRLKRGPSITACRNY